MATLPFFTSSVKSLEESEGLPDKGTLCTRRLFKASQELRLRPLVLSRHFFSAVKVRLPVRKLQKQTPHKRNKRKLVRLKKHAFLSLSLETSANFQFAPSTSGLEFPSGPRGSHLGHCLRVFRLVSRRGEMNSTLFACCDQSTLEKQSGS